MDKRSGSSSAATWGRFFGVVLWMLIASIPFLLLWLVVYFF